MDGVNIVIQAKLNQCRNIQIRFDRLARIANLIRFVGFEAMERISIFMSVNGNGAEPKFGGTSQNSNSNFATVGDKQFFNRFHKFLLEQSTGDKGSKAMIKVT